MSQLNKSLTNLAISTQHAKHALTFRSNNVNIVHCNDPIRAGGSITNAGTDLRNEIINPILPMQIQKNRLKNLNTKAARQQDQQRDS